MNQKHTDAEYISADPFFGDESQLTCRNVAIKTARKKHTCFSIDGKQDHEINPGERYRFETARVDGSFWGSYKICLKCMDAFIADLNGELDDDDEVQP
jgi:hypothetical protein